MKKKFMKRVISILLYVAVLCCADGEEGLLISAENRYDITFSITYPRSGEAPEIPSDFESLSSLDLTYLGCEWKTADNTEQWDDGTEFIEWMYTFVNSRNYNSLQMFLYPAKKRQPSLWWTLQQISNLIHLKSI